ncbi:MAG: O-antigen ligase family protein [Sulfuritalea sp.]|nr:O-antigen ligase family protein [Sulfuritalea sp.]
MENTRGLTAKQWLATAWLAVVVFVFPIPHTIALRNLLLLIGFIALVWNHRQSLPRLAPWLKPAAWWLAALTAWIVFHSVAVAPAPTLALDQFRANWLMPLLIGAVGAWAAIQLPRGRALQAIIAALAAHSCWLIGWQFELWLVADTGTFKATPDAWPFKATPFGAYDFHATINGFFLALLVAERLAWVFGKRSPSAFGRWWGWVLLLLSALSDLALQSRIGTIVSMTMLLAAILIFTGMQSRHWRFIVIALSMIALLGAGSLKFDNDRWSGLSESIAVGWSSPNIVWFTVNEESWEMTKWPETPSGKRIEFSAFFRAMMARQASDFLAEHPMGIGFGHDAFGRAIALKHGHTGLGSSHNGWLDFALGTGFVGLALLLATAGAAINNGWRAFRERDNIEALLLVFFVGNYTLRCLLDGHLSGWRLGMFAFICGILIAAVSNPRRES